MSNYGFVADKVSAAVMHANINTQNKHALVKLIHLQFPYWNTHANMHIIRAWK
jgi:hypothetical protein